MQPMLSYNIMLIVNRFFTPNNIINVNKVNTCVCFRSFYDMYLISHSESPYKISHKKAIVKGIRKG